MKQHLNDVIGFTIFLFSIISMPLGLAWANVETISVSGGDVVSKEISINPGFAVMFQFPEEVQALTLADQTAFACDKMPTDSSRLLCKPLTQSPFTTNLVVSTSKNEFNLVLNVDPSGKKHPFKYVFSDGKSHSSLKTNRDPSQNHGNTTSSGINLMDMILDHYESTSCHAKGENSTLRFRCLELIEIGTDRYMRFSLSVSSDSSIRIIKMALNTESLGGLTGLSVADESSLDVDYSLKHDSIGRGEESIGIVKLPGSDTGDGKRHCLFVLTDRGQEGDLRVYGF